MRDGALLGVGGVVHLGGEVAVVGVQALLVARIGRVGRAQHALPVGAQQVGGSLRLGRRRARFALEASQGAQQVLLAPLALGQPELRLERRRGHRLGDAFALRRTQAPIELLGALDRPLHGGAPALQRVALQEVVLEFGVDLGLLALEVLQLVGLKAGRHGGRVGQGLLRGCAHARAHFFPPAATLGRRGVLHHLVCGAAEQRGVARQLFPAVPGEPARDRLAAIVCLRVVEVDVAVEPPVGQAIRLPVGQAQGAAAGQGQQQGGRDNAPPFKDK